MYLDGDQLKFTITGLGYQQLGVENVGFYVDAVSFTSEPLTVQSVC